MREQGRNGYNEAEINGKHYQIGGRVATRSLAPGERAGRGVHAITPHPNPVLREQGWRMAWIFLPVFFCVIPLILYALAQA